MRTAGQPSMMAVLFTGSLAVAVLQWPVVVVVDRQSIDAFHSVRWLPFFLAFIIQMLPLPFYYNPLLNINNHHRRHHNGNGRRMHACKPNKPIDEQASSTNQPANIRPQWQ